MQDKNTRCSHRMQGRLLTDAIATGQMYVLADTLFTADRTCNSTPARARCQVGLHALHARMTSQCLLGSATSYSATSRRRICAQSAVPRFRWRSWLKNLGVAGHRPSSYLAARAGNAARLAPRGIHRSSSFRHPGACDRVPWLLTGCHGRRLMALCCIRSLFGSLRLVHGFRAPWLPR